MFKTRVVILLAVLVLIFASFIPVMAQSELPILEEDFLNAEVLVVFCFQGTENYYDFLSAETEEDAFNVLVEGVGLDEDTATAFMTDLVTLSEELGDVDEVTAKSWFYALVITHCFGEEAVATVAEAEDPGYYIEYFGLDEEAGAYFYYLYEETYFYMSVEVYLIDLGIDPAYIDEILSLLDDEEALAAYFVEIGIEIDLEAFYADLEVLEADAEDDFTEDEAYVEDEDDEDSDDDGIADDEDEDDDGDGIADDEDEDDDGDGIGDDEDDEDGDDEDGDDEDGDDEDGDDGEEDEGGDDEGGDDEGE
jgi:hypothetical protein